MMRIDDSLYEELITLIDLNQKHIEDRVKRNISHLKNELPILMDIKQYVLIDTGQSLDTIMTTDFLHMKNSSISNKLNNLTTKFNMGSSSNNGPIRINARRFRYTLGTRLAKEGASVEVIAKALDHKSINSSGIYVKNCPDNVHDIDKMLNPFLNRYQRYFLEKNSQKTRSSLLNIF
jgi:integrase